MSHHPWDLREFSGLESYFRKLSFKIVVHETDNMCDKNGFIAANLCTSTLSFDTHSWTARFIYLDARSDRILTFEMLMKKFVTNARSTPAGSAKIEAIEQDVVTDIEKCAQENLGYTSGMPMVPLSCLLMYTYWSAEELCLRIWKNLLTHYDTSANLALCQNRPDHSEMDFVGVHIISMIERKSLGSAYGRIVQCILQVHDM